MHKRACFVSDRFVVVVLSKHYCKDACFHRLAVLLSVFDLVLNR